MRSPVPRSKSLSSCWLGGALCALAALVIAGAATGQDEPFQKPRALKVCDDPNNLPFSNDKDEGFENKIAAILARNLDLPLEVFHYPQRMNIVRNTIRYKLPNESEYRCDLLTGVPSDFTAFATTRPYYRSTYVLLSAKGRKLDVSGEDHFPAPNRPLRRPLKLRRDDHTQRARPVSHPRGQTRVARCDEHCRGGQGRWQVEVLGRADDGQAAKKEGERGDRLKERGGEEETAPRPQRPQGERP